jgi:hypothetical protein
MGVSGQRHAPAALYPGERIPVPIVQEAGCAPEPVQIFQIKDMQGKWANLFFTDLLSLISTNDSRLMKSAVCLSVYPPLVTFEPVGIFS